MKFARSLRSIPFGSRRRFAAAVGFAAAFLSVSLALAAGYGPVVVHAGNVVITVDGSISPSNLPKHNPTPITAKVQGSLKTTDGSHVPAASMVTLDIDKDFSINTEGLPTCRLSELLARSSKDALRACSDALVGRGSAEAEVAFPEQEPFSARGPLLFFNGGVRGGTTLLFVHLFAPLPSPTAVVAIVKLRKIHDGRYGTRATVAVPKIANGSGSVTQFAFQIGRNLPGSGGRRGYVEAHCPGTKYLTRAKVKLVGGASYSASLALPCRGGGPAYGNGGYAGP